MLESEGVIPTATEVTIIIAEPIVETNRDKCKISFCAAVCSVGLFMVAWVMFVFWNQRPH